MAALEGGPHDRDAHHPALEYAPSYAGVKQDPEALQLNCLELGNDGCHRSPSDTSTSIEVQILKQQHQLQHPDWSSDQWENCDGKSNHGTFLSICTECVRVCVIPGQEGRPILPQGIRT